jgi:tetratricopeptide (TPR) repeat protein
MYSLLDSRRGRIFTYDEEGNLLYIFGGIGTQRGTFHTPVAIASSGDMLFALDSFRAEIIVFNPTEYGRLINAAVALRHGGNDVAAVEYWREVLRFNENFELANANIGRSYLAAGNNRMAMHYLRLGMDRDFYSVAFRRHRNDILVDNLGWALTGAIGLIFGLILLRRLVFRKKKAKEEEGVWNE